MEDKTEDGVIVEEGGGGVGSRNSPWTASRNDFSSAPHGGDQEEESEKGDEEDPYVAWDEVYEQEV